MTEYEASPPSTDLRERTLTIASPRRENNAETRSMGPSGLEMLPRNTPSEIPKTPGHPTNGTTAISRFANLRLIGPYEIDPSAIVTAAYMPARRPVIAIFCTSLNFRGICLATAFSSKLTNCSGVCIAHRRPGGPRAFHDSGSSVS